MKTIVTFLTITLLVACLFGCGGDDIKGNGSVADPTPDDDNQIPTVTIEELQNENARAAGKILWRLNTSPAPKTDLVVMGNFRHSRWVIIPKSKNSSEEFSDTLFNGKIQIDPLPMVSIVGKGLVVDLEKLAY